MIRVCLIVVLALFSTTAFSQSSLVPSHHPVYEWLYMQRVKGLLPDYDYESLPLLRITLVQHLDRLEEQDDKLPDTELKTLRSFQQEFDASNLRKNYDHSLITPDTRFSAHRFREWITGPEEKHTISVSDSNKYVVFDHGLGTRFSFARENGTETLQHLNLLQNFRLYGDYKRLLGFHLEYESIPMINFDSRTDNVFQYDGFYSYNWKSLLSVTPNLYHFEAYTSFSYDIFEVSVGTGNLKEGTGLSENLIFSRSSIATDWMRLKADGKYLSYNMQHIRLSWPHATDENSEGEYSKTDFPQRWIAYHKLNIHPVNWLTVSLYEMVNYSGRNIEFSYLNPAARQAFALWELQNPDNGWNGGIIQLRPLKGVELFTELLIDDLGTSSDIISKKQYPMTSRFGRRYGFHYVSDIALQFWSEYTRIDPFLYSHPVDTDAHADKGIGLGSQIGPNADRLEFGIKKWGIGRTYLSLAYSYDRQGLDIYNEEGERIFLAGASVNDGRDLPIERSNLFLDGDLHRWHRVEVNAQWEIMRAWTLKAHLEHRSVIEGNQMQDRTIGWVDFIVAF